MADLNIRLLGGVSIFNGDQRLDNKLSSKAISIISLLIISENKRMNKSRLSSLLWPDSDDEASKYNLRYNLWNIKKLIPNINDNDFIVTDKIDININPEYGHKSDIEIIKGYSNEKQYTKEQLNNIKCLFKGDFLEGVFYKSSPEILDIILMERIYCQKIHTDILKNLYRMNADDNDHDACVYNLLELQRIDPFNEDTAYKIMQHMKKQGKYAKAVSYYKDFSSNLRHDLNISPCNDLRKLYEELTERFDATKITKPPTTEKIKYIIIDTFCMEDVDYFWISECINQIIKKIDGDILNGIDDNILTHLAYISPGIYKYCGNDIHKPANNESVLPIQIINSFYECLVVIAKSISMTINISDFGLMDKPSKSAIMLVEKRPVPGVELIYH